MRLLRLKICAPEGTEYIYIAFPYRRILERSSCRLLSSSHSLNTIMSLLAGKYEFACVRMQFARESTYVFVSVIQGAIALFVGIFAIFSISKRTLSDSVVSFRGPRRCIRCRFISDNSRPVPSRRQQIRSLTPSSVSSSYVCVAKIQFTKIYINIFLDPRRSSTIHHLH